jgi:hypothetical protein
VLWLGLAALFVVIVAIWAMGRKARLAKLSIWPGEELLLERDGVRLLVVAGPRRETRIFRSFVRVTNRRIVVGTGSVRKPDKAMIYAVGVLEGGEAFGAGPLDDGFVTFPTRRDEVRFEGTTVRFGPAPEGAGFGVPVSIGIETDADGVEALRTAIVDQRPPAPPNVATARYRA